MKPHDVPRLETKRLFLRPFGPADVEEFHAIWGDPEVIWWGASPSLEETRTRFADLLARHAEWPAGVGWFALLERASGQLVGDVLLQPAKFAEGIEIGWHMRRDAWGRGLATEGARAVLRHGFETVGLGHLYAIVATRNAPSLRVVEKLGFRAEKDMPYAGWPHRLFVIEAPGG